MIVTSKNALSNDADLMFKMQQCNSRGIWIYQFCYAGKFEHYNSNIVISINKSMESTSIMAIFIVFSVILLQFFLRLQLCAMNGLQIGDFPSIPFVLSSLSIGLRCRCTKLMMKT